jgi:hypothetical protein
VACVCFFLASGGLGLSYREKDKVSARRRQAYTGLYTRRGTVDAGCKALRLRQWHSAVCSSVSLPSHGVAPSTTAALLVSNDRSKSCVLFMCAVLLGKERGQENRRDSEAEQDAEKLGEHYQRAPMVFNHN